MSRSGIVIKNVDIITMDKNNTIIKDGYVVIKEDTIDYVGKEISSLHEKYKNYTIIDGGKGILMPGMVNCHTHVSMVPFRSLADDEKDRLKKYIFPLESKLVDRELVYHGAKYGICEMLLSGVTTFCDMYYYEDEVAKACDELNIRAVLGETVVDFCSPDSKLPYGGLEYGEYFIKKWNKNGLITPAIAPHAPYTNDDKHLKSAFNLSKKYNVPMIMHLAEMDFEYEKYKKEYNLTPVQYLNKLGVLDKNFIAAHLVLVNEKDLEILKECSVGVSHNMGANAKGAKGVAPIIEMKKRGIDIGLGTDGPMSGNTLDIITQMSLVGKIHKLYNKDRTILPAKDIVYMATMGGAKALNLDKIIGSVEVGKKADLIILETQSLNMQPIYDYYSTLVYSASAFNVNTVIINGKLVVKHRNIISVDLNDIGLKLINLQHKIKSVLGDNI